MAALGLGALLALVACAPEDADGTEDEVSPEPTATETVTEDPEDSAAGGEHSDPADEPDEEPPAEESDLPPGGAERLEEITEDGEAAQLPGHISAEEAEGAEAGVAGLASEDMPLEVHAAPAPDAEVVAELGQLDAVLLGGRGWSPPEDAEEEGVWTEIQLADGYGWIQGGVYYFGNTEDITDTYIDEVPPAEDEREIAVSVAERAIESDEDLTDEEGEPVGPDWELISSPEDHGEEFYRIDVLGMMDDSRAGERLFISVDEVSDGYQLAQVERTLICYRGVSDRGSCV